MKHLKKMMALIIAMVMVLAMSATVFADGDGSITVTNATGGQTYAAYLIFPASPSNPDDLSAGVTYTATADQVAIDGFDDVFDIFEDADGNYTITINEDASEQDVIDFVKENYEELAQGEAIDGDFSDNTTVVFSGLDYGYYYITSSLGTLITIDTAGKDVDVVDKNESQPEEPEKIITDEESSIAEDLDVTGEELTENNAAVGSVESFSITFQATNWIQDEEDNSPDSGDPEAKHKVLVWKFKDTPTNLEIDPTTVTVTVNGEDVTATIENLAVDSSTGALTFNIPWVDDDENFLYETKTEGSALIPVVVTYDATVLAGAATSPAPNTVEINYDRDDEQDCELGEDTTTTYTYKFLLEKKDENGEALEGAEFQLFFGDSEEPLTFTMNDGKYQYDPEGTETNIAPTGDPATAEVIGLDDGAYTLKEVVVPSGYTKADDTEVTGLVKEDGESEASATTISVENEKGTLLPSTGGIGTTIFYVIGAILVVGAGVILVTRRRMNAN